MNAKVNELKFGTSGLRDTVEHMTDMECYINARGFIAYLQDSGEFKKGDTVAIGGDRRPSTYRIKRSVAAAIADMGGKVSDQGQVPSPALAYYAMCNAMASIMVTGSHIPADRNGIKFTKRSGEILKSDESGILENVRKERLKVYSAAQEGSVFDNKGTFKAAFESKYQGLLKDECYTGESCQFYIDRYRSVFGNVFFPKGTKIFLYQHSAVGRDIVRDIFEGLGAEVFAPDIRIHNEPLRSSEFVPVDTESVSDKTLGIFKKVLVDNNLDIGITLDGDSDRPLLVYREYENGKPTDNVTYISGDILGLLAILGLQNLHVRVDAVCVPVSANDAIAKVCRNKGIVLTLTKIGSPFVIAAMNDSIGSHAGEWNVFAWESNGGFLTGTDLAIAGKTLKALPTRDAVLPLVSVIHLIAKSGKNVSELIKTLPSRFTHADREKEFPMGTSRAIIDYLTPGDLNDAKELGKIKKRIEKVFLHDDGFGKVADVNYTDGIRIFFDNGEISHLRPSGNAPEFRNYAIADSQERTRDMVRIGLAKVIPKLVEIVSLIDLVKAGTPLYIKPYKEKKVWGVGGIGEYWYGAEAGEKSSLGVIREGLIPMDQLLADAGVDLLGESVIEKFGTFLPLVKILTPKGRLSVQFHDKKNELWVVTGIHKETAGSHPSLICGFSPSLIDAYGERIKEEYEKALRNYGKLLNELIAYLEKSGFEKELEEAGNVVEAAEGLKRKDEAVSGKLKVFLKAQQALDGFYHHVPVDIGDVIPVPQGTLHALGPGITIVEPQIPGPTQSLEDGATYPVRYFFPDYPVASGKKKLDLDRIGEICTKKWTPGDSQLVDTRGGVSVERLPGGFEAKGMQVNRITIPANEKYLNENVKSCHMLVIIKGRAHLVIAGKKFPIPEAKAGSEMLLVPASSGSFSVLSDTQAQLLDIFTPV
ncbi:MAG TPA: hypothetical protein VMD52_07155 [Patescibacteria group bacterium]|nr:hypothetical protein [Patescibacteria group bacterium]